MQDNFLVSVIIPVFNAESFILKAVHSALMQVEVGEVILIEDCSTDDSYAICKELAEKNNNVQLFQHNDKKNHGAGPSRSLGIQKAKFDYVAFLDADDYYLNERFKETKNIFNNCNVDAIGEPVGVHFYTKNTKKQFSNVFRIEKEAQDFSTKLNANIKPYYTKYYLVSEHKGYFHLDGMTFKKQSLLDVGDFSSLRLSQDTEYIIRFAGQKKIFAHNCDNPVARRGLHSNNRFINNKSHKHTRDTWKYILKSSFSYKSTFLFKLLILMKYFLQELKVVIYR